ncbi:MAG: copper-binding protein [Phycisphaerales bacterium]
MKARTVLIAFAVVCVIAVAVAGVLVRKKPAASASGAFALGKVEVIAPTTPAEYSYTSRGVVVGLPEAQFRPGGVIYLQLHHENIPDFTLENGVKAGMNEMIMDFPTISPNVSFTGLKVGDKVEFVMEVRWKSEPRFVVTRLEKLDPATKLQLGAVVEPEKASGEK